MQRPENPSRPDAPQNRKLNHLANSLVPAAAAGIYTQTLGIKANIQLSARPEPVPLMAAGWPVVRRGAGARRTGRVSNGVFLRGSSSGKLGGQRNSNGGGRNSVLLPASPTSADISIFKPPFFFKHTPPPILVLSPTRRLNGARGSIPYVKSAKKKPPATQKPRTPHGCKEVIKQAPKVA